jgi:hypothetical protein
MKPITRRFSTFSPVARCHPDEKPVVQTVHYSQPSRVAEILQIRTRVEDPESEQREE